MSDEGRYDDIKRKMRRDNAIFIVILTLSGAAALVEYWLGIGGPVFAMIILFFVAFAVVAIFRMLMADRMLKKIPEYMPDERVMKIDTYARSLSWYVTFCLVCLLVGLTAFHIIDPGAYLTLILIFLVMGYSWLVFKWYYGRKGDVQ